MYPRAVLIRGCLSKQSLATPLADTLGCHDGDATLKNVSKDPASHLFVSTA
ncbi:hypothetical protein IF2G_03431 [Cordyceps javanica]|nr:hypothetical protein IF2G_03431 [Cordyceps javanica]